MHMRLVAHGLREGRKKARHQVFVRLRVGRDTIVTGHASLLILAHAAENQIDLVAKIIVQNPMRELGILCYLAQASAGVAQFRKRGRAASASSARRSANLSTRWRGILSSLVTFCKFALALPWTA